MRRADDPPIARQQLLAIGLVAADVTVERVSLAGSRRSGRGVSSGAWFLTSTGWRMGMANVVDRMRNATQGDHREGTVTQMIEDQMGRRSLSPGFTTSW